MLRSVSSISISCTARICRLWFRTSAPFRPTWRPRPNRSSSHRLRNEGQFVMENEYDGLRTYIEAVRGIGQVKDIDGADWDLEIGTLTEAVTEMIAEPPMMLFDKIKGYPQGFRVLSLPVASKKRVA